MSPENALPLSLTEALHHRLDAPTHLGDRRHYLGASEVGTCLRRVVASKLTPEVFVPTVMGRMLAGRALENEVVQLARHALKGRLRNTGRNQMEVRHPVLAFVAHPDGRIVGESSDGILEVKTASSAVFKRYQQEGLPRHYQDQVQSQMGLSGLTWALVVLVSRENLAEIATFHLRFDEPHFAALVQRAKRWQDAMREGSLPDGEPERGFCHGCPLRKECPQQRATPGQKLPELERLRLECHMEELVGLEHELAPLEARQRELRDQVRDLLDEHGVGKVAVEAGLAQLVTSSRTGLDTRRLQQEAPDIYQRFQRTSSFTNLRLTFHGAVS